MSNAKEKEALLQLLLEKHYRTEAKSEATASIAKETKKYSKAKRVRRNKDRIKWSPEMKAQLIDWNEKGYALEAFAQMNNLRKAQVTAMLYDLLNRHN